MDKVGAVSSSTIVKVPVASLMVALVGLESVIVAVSDASSKVSAKTPTLKVAEVAPAAIVTVPEAAIAAGATSATFNVPVSADTLDEASETATMTLSSPTNATISDATGTLTIVDDDTAPTLSINDVSYTESGTGGNATFTVTLSEVSAQNVTVDYASSDVSTTAGSDYTSSTGTVTILAGNTTQTFNVPVLVDTLDEVNETSTLTLSNPTNATISDATGTLTIVDDDATPSLSINDNAMTEDPSDLSFTVSLSAASSKEITVNYAAADITAIGAFGGGTDYRPVSTTALTFAPGETSKTIDVRIWEDADVESTETFSVNLTSPINATISDSQGIGSIYNDDVAEAQPTLTINNVSLTENSTNMTFTVTASGTYSSNVTFDYSTANGTASAGADYTNSSGTGTIIASSTTTTITVPILEDSSLEDNETFYVNLSNPNNATISDSQGVGTITDDDCDPDGITYVNDNVVINNSANQFVSKNNSSSGSGDSSQKRFVITQEKSDAQWSGTSSQTFDTYTGFSSNIVYGKNKAGNATTSSVTSGDYFNSYLIYLNDSINRRASNDSGTIRFEHNIMGMYYGNEDTTSTPSIMSQFEKTGATYSSSSVSGANKRDFENEGGGDWITMTTSGTYAYKEIKVGAKNGAHGDFLRVITNSCLTDGIVVGVEYTTSSGLKGFTDKDGNFSHYIGDDVTFNVGGVVLGTATAEDLSAGRVFLQDIADVDRTTLNGTYLENMATFLQSLDDNNDAYDNIVISQAIRDALVHETLDLRAASEEEVESLINKVGGIWVEEEDAMTHVKDMLIKYSDLTEADFEEKTIAPKEDIHVDTIDIDSLLDDLKPEVIDLDKLGSVKISAMDLEISDLLDIPGDEVGSVIDETESMSKELEIEEEVGEKDSETEEGSVLGSTIAPIEFMDSLLVEVPEIIN